MKKWILLVCALFTTACGFHLRGVMSEEFLVKEIALVLPAQTDSEAVNALKNSLKNNDIAINPSSDWKLELSEFYHRESEIAIGGHNGNTKDKMLLAGYKVVIFYQDKELDSTTLSARANVQYNSGEYIGSQEEAQLTWRHLSENNADATLRFLQSVSDNFLNQHKQ